VKYLIMIYHTQQALDSWANMSAAQRAEGMRAHDALVEALAESGELVVSEALASPAQGKTVAVHEGAATVTDGPFAEVKEHLAGFYLVECDSIDQAVGHAARIPDAAFGRVEIRPVLARNGLEM
jgi:hypothetical protein